MGVSLKFPANELQLGELIVAYFLFSCVTLSQTARLIPEMWILFQNKNANLLSLLPRYCVVLHLLFFDAPHKA